jgi:large subunit ribosomal protein L25
MATANLTASPRNESGKGAARSLRRSGQIPAVIYGHAREPQSLAINERDLDRLLQRIVAESTVIELDLDGSVKRTLIKEIQRHPFKRQILHVDFQELVAGEKVVVSIPIVLVGVPEGVRTGGGMLDQVMRELEIEVDPSSIPNHVDLDVKDLTIGHSLHVSDLQLPAGVTVLDDDEATVCVLTPPRTVQEETPADAPAAEGAEPEVIRARKPDDEDES